MPVAEPSHCCSHAHRYGVGSVDGNVTHAVRDDGVGSTIREHAHAKKVVVAVRRLGSIMRQLRHTHVTLVKFDVATSEYLALQNGLDTFELAPMDQVPYNRVFNAKQQNKRR